LQLARTQLGQARQSLRWTMAEPTPAQLDAMLAPAAVDISDEPLLGEGGQIGKDLCTMEPRGRHSVAIIGGTGYVGRLLARRLLSHPTMYLGFIVGSKRSEGQLYQDVWEEKEAALMKNCPWRRTSLCDGKTTQHSAGWLSPLCVLMNARRWQPALDRDALPTSADRRQGGLPRVGARERL
jgi:hypothetical protein